MKLKTTILILFLFYFLEYLNAEENNNVEIINIFHSSSNFGKDKNNYDLVFKTNNSNNFYIGIGTSINSFFLNYFDI